MRPPAVIRSAAACAMNSGARALTPSGVSKISGVVSASPPCTRDAGVVDDDVEAGRAGAQQQLLVERPRTALDVAVGAERLADRERVGADPRDRLGRRRSALRPVVDGHERAVARQPLGDRAADPARGARHQRHLALQFCSHRYRTLARFFSERYRMDRHGPPAQLRPRCRPRAGDARVLGEGLRGDVDRRPDAAMGIAAPSLYAAFGDKRALFEEAVELYETDPRANAIDALRTRADGAARWSGPAGRGREVHAPDHPRAA